MRKPNGYGSVLKLSGNRRKPYAVRVTQGWDTEGKQKYKYLGYFSSRKDAEICLAEYNKNPFMVSEEITFSELYERYSAAKYQNLSASAVRLYTSAYKSCADLFTVPITKLNLGALQTHIDTCSQNRPMLVSVKTLWGAMFDYAIRNQWLPPERRAIVSHVDISVKGNPNAIGREAFSHDEIKLLWEHSHEKEVQFILILIYTGVRIGELLNLSPEDIHGDYFEVKQAKTSAGIREVPIADKIKPFFDYPKCGYSNFTKMIWKPFMEKLNMTHRPHDTRHTLISLLTEKEVDPRIIKSIVGHKGDGVTERIYTHIPISKKLEAVNLLD